MACLKRCDMDRFLVTYTWRGDTHKIVILANDAGEVYKAMDYYDIVSVRYIDIDEDTQELLCA